MVKNAKSYVHEESSFEIIFQGSQIYQEVIKITEQVKYSPKVFEFLTFQLNMKNDFLKEDEIQSNA